MFVTYPHNRLQNVLRERFIGFCFLHFYILFALVFIILLAPYQAQAMIYGNNESFDSKLSGDLSGQSSWFYVSPEASMQVVHSSTCYGGAGGCVGGSGTNLVYRESRLIVGLSSTTGSLVWRMKCSLAASTPQPAQHFGFYFGNAIKQMRIDIATGAQYPKLISSTGVTLYSLSSATCSSSFIQPSLEYDLVRHQVRLRYGAQIGAWYYTDLTVFDRFSIYNQIGNSSNYVWIDDVNLNSVVLDPVNDSATAGVSAASDIVSAATGYPNGGGSTALTTTGTGFYLSADKYSIPEMSSVIFRHYYHGYQQVLSTEFYPLGSGIVTTSKDVVYINGVTNYYSFTYAYNGTYTPYIVYHLSDLTDRIVYLGGVESLLSAGKIIVTGSSHVTQPSAGTGYVLQFSGTGGVFGLTYTNLQSTLIPTNSPYWWTKVMDWAILPVLYVFLWAASWVAYVVQQLPFFSFITATVHPVAGSVLTIPTSLLGHTFASISATPTFTIAYANASSFSSMLLVAELVVVIGIIGYFIRRFF